MKRGETWLDRQVSPSFLFLWGLILAPAVVLQDRLWLKAAQAAALVLLAAAAGRLPSPGVVAGSLLFVAATVAVNLLSPVGRVLMRLGPLPVTGGALAAGLRKSLTVLALAYLSRLCVRHDLSLPGPGGRYLRLTFRYLNALLARRRVLAGRDLVGRIDGALEALYHQESFDRVVTRKGNHTTAVGAALLVALAGLIWLPEICPI